MAMPCELMIIASRSADENLAQQNIENHLLDRVLPVAYALREGEPAPPFDLGTSTRLLRYIASGMQDEDEDLAWWRIRHCAPRAPRLIAGTLAIGVVGGLAGGVALVLAISLIIWLSS